MTVTASFGSSRWSRRDRADVPLYALRYRTDEDRRLIVPTDAGAERAAVWLRDGRAEDVLAELLELPAG